MGTQFKNSINFGGLSSSENENTNTEVNVNINVVYQNRINSYVRIRRFDLISWSLDGVYDLGNCNYNMIKNDEEILYASAIDILYDIIPNISNGPEPGARAYHLQYLRVIFEKANQIFIMLKEEEGSSSDSSDSLYSLLLEKSKKGLSLILNAGTVRNKVVVSQIADVNNACEFGGEFEFQDETTTTFKGKGLGLGLGFKGSKSKSSSKGSKGEGGKFLVVTAGAGGRFTEGSSVKGFGKGSGGKLGKFGKGVSVSSVKNSKGNYNYYYNYYPGGWDPNASVSTRPKGMHKTPSIKGGMEKLLWKKKILSPSRIKKHNTKF